MAAAPAVVQALASPRTARSAGSVVDAATRVLPVASSTSWAPMWRRLRNTASRGRAAVPDTCLRTRRWRRARAARRSCFVNMLISLLSHYYLSFWLLCLAGLPGLAGLAAELLAPVQDPLPLIRLGLPEGTNLGSHLADHLLVRPADTDLSGYGD